MRDEFIAKLYAIAQQRKEIVLITGDLGFGVLTKWWETLPAQFINAGVAEQSMTGLAAGMALDGKISFTYSIANFPTLRAIEQLRNDAAYHDANVKVIAIGGGFSYGALGMSHHATEDLAILRALPNITVLSPGCLWEAEQMAQVMVDTPGTCYLRIDKSSAGRTNTEGETLTLGRMRELRSGNDAAIFATGGILDDAIKASDALKADGIGLAVYSVHSLRPFDSDTLIAASKRTGNVFTLEEHVVDGGLGGLVAETLLEAGAAPKRFYRFGLRGGYSSIVGSQEYLRARHGLDAVSITERMRSMLRS
jgi:transketolase